MKINNEQQALEAIESWRTAPLRAQQRNLQMAKEHLELSQMYYEQKGNEQGSERANRCIALLSQRINELESL
ncbi:MAG: hypothetical protein OEY01_08100 [Desulfobulbaceae bacterium]|nr:hypothetical protein [Desulfobulbaceae bacterium]